MAARVTQPPNQPRQAIDRSAQARQLHLAAISLWKAQRLQAKGRLQLNQPLELWLRQAAAPELIKVLPLDAEVVIRVNSRPDDFRGDPADRLLVATALAHGLRLASLRSRGGWRRSLALPWCPCLGMERKLNARWPPLSLGRRSGSHGPYDLLAVGIRLRSGVCSLAMAVISLKLPDALDAELAAQAQLRRLSKSELMRRALRAFLQSADGMEAQPAPSAFDRVADLVGCCEGGPPDLSSNPAHLAGFGER